jgi:hypothetical protein
LTRCCFENLLRLVELAAKREDFVEEMVRDEVSSQQARGNIVLSWSDKLEDQEAYVEGLRASLDRMKRSIRKLSPYGSATLEKRIISRRPICGLGSFHLKPHIRP